MRTRLWISLLAALVALVVTAAAAPAAMARHTPPRPVPPPTITDYPGSSGSWYPALGPDGNIWTVGGENVVRTLSHAPYTVTKFTVPGDDDYLSDIVTGPDGNLWFTDQGDFDDPGGHPGQIGRILSHAPYTITMFNVGPSQDRLRPFQITVGPDRNLYFVDLCEQGNPAFPSCPDNSGGIVERITPFGSNARIQASVTDVVAKTSTCTSACNELLDITTGPDGNLWLATPGDIDRLTLHGYHLTKYPIPNGDGAFQITSGPDKALWFTALYGDLIGRVPLRDPSNITLYPASTTSADETPIGITTGPDGNIWYAEPGTYAVGTFSPSAPDKLTEYKDPSGARPYGITAGPCDNTLWYSTDADNEIGRIQLPGRVKDRQTCPGGHGGHPAPHR